MVMKIRPLVGAMALAMAATSAHASIDIGEGNGTLNAGVKAVHVVSGLDNGFDKTTGSAYQARIKYVSPTKEGLKFGVAFYKTGALGGLTDFDAGSSIAKGLFATDVAGNEEDGMNQLGEAYIDWSNDKHHAFAGRMSYKTPLTATKDGLMPSFFTLAGVNTKALGHGIELGIAHATQMSLGSRTRTEWGLIGESTGTAGTAINPVTSNPATSLGQAEFHSIGDVQQGVGGESTAGLTVLSAKYKAKGASLEIWDYYAHDVTNTIYLEGKKAFPMKGAKLKVAAQYLTQSEIGKKLYNNTSVSDAGQDIDFTMYGIKASVGNKKWGVYAAYNSSTGDTKMVNAFGGDPAYTSTTFSRNAYRENVTAYKVGGHYAFAPGWKVKVGMANYGQSDTTLSTGATTAQTDATETDVALIWKPVKNTTVKLVHAQRTSEFDGASGSEKNMAHTRLIASYKF